MSDPRSLHVWVDPTAVVLLAQVEQQKYVFSYKQDAVEAVSLTMPVRVEI